MIQKIMIFVISISKFLYERLKTLLPIIERNMKQKIPQKTNNKAHLITLLKNKSESNLRKYRVILRGFKCPIYLGTLDYSCMNEYINL